MFAVDSNEWQFQVIGSGLFSLQLTYGCACDIPGCDCGCESAYGDRRDIHRPRLHGGNRRRGPSLRILLRADGTRPCEGGIRRARLGTLP